MPRCQAIKKDGTQCKGTAREGYKWCAYHRKRFAKMVKHGNYATPEVLGIPQNEHLTFQQFYQKEKPFDLLSELAYARTILVEQRKALQSRDPKIRESLLNDFVELSKVDLQSYGMQEDVADKILQILKIRLGEVLNEYYGDANLLPPEQFRAIGESLDRVARIAEKAKKIAEGITLNVNFGNVGLILIKFVREVIMAEVKDPYVRARIVERVRSMNLTKLPQHSEEEVISNE